MQSFRFALVFMLTVACGGQAVAQNGLGTTPADKKNTPAQYKPNEQLKNGVPAMYGQGGANLFHTPVGPAGAKANVFAAPAPGFANRSLPTQAPALNWWQRFKNYFGFGAPPVPGTVPPQLPPGTAIGSVGGR